MLNKRRMHTALVTIAFAADAGRNYTDPDAMRELFYIIRDYAREALSPNNKQKGANDDETHLPRDQ